MINFSFILTISSVNFFLVVERSKETRPHLLFTVTITEIYRLKVENLDWGTFLINEGQIAYVASFNKLQHTDFNYLAPFFRRSMHLRD